MPAGVPWGPYLRFLTASMLSMFAGAQVMHKLYNPDLSIPDVPPKPGELKTEIHQVWKRPSSDPESSSSDGKAA
ncbi:ubiquinol-cytochrome-c reductase complex assembly factor 6-like [Branchiostoma floridae x Branchiostoma belcheri]